MSGPKPLTILANLGHGNGPTVSLLLAAEAFQQITGRSVNLIFPYRGERQRQVIAWRKHPKRDVCLFFDHALGALLFPITLRQNDFRQNVRDVLAYQPAVQALARAYVARGLSTRDESGDERHFNVGQVDLELNHGSRIRLLDEAYYFFPCLLSDLLRHAADIPETERRAALEQIEALEAGYKRLFLPAVHTFSWDEAWQPPANATLGPFPRPLIADPPAVPGRGLYVMQSGVGPAGDTLITQATLALLEGIHSHEGQRLNVYCPPGTTLPDIANKIEVSPTAIANPAVKGVIGRAGWGTLWECFNAATPFIAIPPIPGDDPEILFNRRTLKATGLGLLWGEDHISREAIRRVKGALEAYHARLETRFGTLDGLSMLAQTILLEIE